MAADGHRNGKVAVVTGSGSGIGRGIARRFALEGMRLALIDLNRQRLDDVVAELPGSIALEVDVSDPGAVDAAARRCAEELGPVSVLCANAGINGPTGRRLWELTPSDWEHTMDVNLMGPINCVRSFMPQMLESGGEIVITSSMSGVTPRASAPVYAASKHALLSVAESLRLQVDRDGLPITVSVLLPASVSTNFADSHDAEWESAKDGPVGTSPQLLDPSVVADQVVDALNNRRLYVFTHLDSKQRIDRWYEDVISGYSVFT